MCPARRLILPLALLAMGILLLIGCVTIPATRQLQPDWKRRPEHFIGTEADKPVRIGYTTLDDAFLELNPRTGAQVSSSGWGTTVSTRINPPWSILNWNVSRDRREFVLMYHVRTATDIYPLCFMATPRTEPRWLMLQVDEQMTITSATTTTQPVASAAPVPADEWLQIFDEARRRKLQSAGMLPADDVLAEAGRSSREGQRRIAEQAEARRRRAKQSTTTRF